jgi:hypothetical protein
MRTMFIRLMILLSLLSVSPSFGQPLAEAKKVVAKATSEQRAKWLTALKEERDQAEAVKNKFEAVSQACGVGYLPAQFAGKPDPWPGDVPLPNDQLLAAYIARYGQPPGSGGSRIGYCCELFGLNYEALENAAKAGAAGPSGEQLHPGCASTTEATDGSFAIPRGSPFVGLWVAAKRDGGTPEKAVVVHEAANPCGPSSNPKGLFGAYPLFVDNQPPCGGTTTTCGNGKIDPGETCASCPQDIGPCPTCGNGKVDPGETCVTCPQDVGACPPPQCPAPKVCMIPPEPCPTLAAVPLSAKDACKQLLTWYKKGTGRYKIVHDACEVIGRAEAYKPGV